MTFPSLSATRSHFVRQCTSSVYWWPILIIGVLGISARFAISMVGHNFDFDSYTIVAGIVHGGGNVYAETERYKYAPPWFWLLGLFDWTASLFPYAHESVFRALIIGLLTAADAGICLMLWRSFGRRAALVFWLNPLSIVLTGYHNGFDNLALAFGMLAVLVMGEETGRRLERRQWLGLAILGMSIAIKHILFAFPLWLALKRQGIWAKLVTLLLPATLFGLTFIPYWSSGAEGIVENVFRYTSIATHPLYRVFLPAIVTKIIDPRLIWIEVLVAFALAFRREPELRSLLLYTGIMVSTAPGLGNQYLAIVLPLTAVYLNPFFVLLSACASWFLLFDEAGLHLMAPSVWSAAEREAWYAALEVLLVLGLTWLLVRRHRMRQHAGPANKPPE